MMASVSRSVDAEKQSGVIFSLSPVAGIGAIAVLDRTDPYSTAVQAAAITPALLFIFVFNSLLISARRRAYKEFLIAAGAAGKPVSAVHARNINLDFVAPVTVDAALESAG